MEILFVILRHQNKLGSPAPPPSSVNKIIWDSFCLTGWWGSTICSSCPLPPWVVQMSGLRLAIRWTQGSSRWQWNADKRLLHKWKLLPFLRRFSNVFSSASFLNSHFLSTCCCFVFLPTPSYGCFRNCPVSFSDTAGVLYQIFFWCDGQTCTNALAHHLQATAQKEGKCECSLFGSWQGCFWGTR